MNKEEEIIIAGIFPCIEALKKGVTIEKVMLKKGLGGPNVEQIKSLAMAQDISIQYVPIEKLNRVTRVRHQGVVLIQSFVEYYSLEQIIPHIYEQGEIPLGLVLDRVTDVRNFGAICRSAECMGCHFVVIPKKNAAKINDEALKSSAGALHHLPICRVSSLRQAIDFLQSSGLKAIGASEKATENIFQADLTTPLVIVMGSEKDGISNDISNQLDELFKIPMRGKVNSLNVSVSAGMILMEVSRQRL